MLVLISISSADECLKRVRTWMHIKNGSMLFYCVLYIGRPAGGKKNANKIITWSGNWKSDGLSLKANINYPPRTHILFIILFLSCVCNVNLYVAHGYRFTVPFTPFLFHSHSSRNRLLIKVYVRNVWIRWQDAFCDIVFVSLTLLSLSVPDKHNEQESVHSSLC